MDRRGNDKIVDGRIAGRAMVVRSTGWIGRKSGPLQEARGRPPGKRWLQEART